MNDEPTDLSGGDTSQEAREQQAWERLQFEAIAAQRWRLEQEMQEANCGGIDPLTMQLLPGKQGQASQLTTIAVISFVVITLLGTIAYAL